MEARLVGCRASPASTMCQAGHRLRDLRGANRSYVFPFAGPPTAPKACGPAHCTGPPGSRCCWPLAGPFTHADMGSPLLSQNRLIFPQSGAGCLLHRTAHRAAPTPWPSRGRLLGPRWRGSTAFPVLKAVTP